MLRIFLLFLLLIISPVKELKAECFQHYLITYSVTNSNYPEIKLPTITIRLDYPCGMSIDEIKKRFQTVMDTIVQDGEIYNIKYIRRVVKV